MTSTHVRARFDQAPKMALVFLEEGGAKGAFRGGDSMFETVNEFLRGFCRKLSSGNKGVNTVGVLLKGIVNEV